MTGQRFLDPLYGPMEVHPRDRPLVFSAEFQRLRAVRLCNINSLFITGASEPKRFEHCIGVYHLADLWAQSRGLAERDARILRSAALVHDLQTGPFGHSFQYVLEDNPFDQPFEHADIAGGVQAGFLQRAQAGAAYAGRPFSVAALLGDIGPEVFQAVRGEGRFGALIAGTLDFDNLDNVVRLAYHVGLCDDADRALPKRLTPLLAVENGRLAVAGGAAPLLEQWFRLRRDLYEYLLLDRGEFAAKAMLTHAVEGAVEAKLLGPDCWRMTDDEFLSELENESIGENQMIRKTIRRLRLGDLFECIDVWSSTSSAMYGTLSGARAKRTLEKEVEEIARQQGAARLRVCLHLILDRKKTCRSLTYFDLEDRKVKIVGTDSDALLVGGFITNAKANRISEHDRSAYGRAIISVLEQAGLQRLQRAPEPLAAHDEQHGLLTP